MAATLHCRCLFCFWRTLHNIEVTHHDVLGLILLSCYHLFYSESNAVNKPSVYLMKYYLEQSGHQILQNVLEHSTAVNI